MALVTRPCAQCGADFTVRESRFNQGRGKYWPPEVLT
jgi:hypothetical protein